MNLTRLILKSVAVLQDNLLYTDAAKKKVTNAILVLSRALPFVIEDKTDGFYEKLLWQNEVPLCAVEGDESTVPLEAEEAALLSPTLQPLAKRIILLCYQYLFLPGFTVIILNLIIH